MIEAYEFGVIRIDGREYDRDLIVSKERVFEHWWRREGHLVQIEDLDEALREKPEVLIVGTGYSGCMSVAGDVQEYLKSKGVQLIVKNTRKAVDVFNEQLEKRRVVAALHLTC